MHPYVLAVTGASAQPLAERTLQLLLKAGRSVHLVLSKGAYAVFKASRVSPSRSSRTVRPCSGASDLTVRMVIWFVTAGTTKA